ncbi:hypothetical protein [Gemmata massiliana]|uniref:hypothetical protein n=1 Tax=Gemmata massiliana TaxID=1210884 RepID=UPI0013A6AF82|nr:hypothetical protein [Gemmata massiliana]
MVGHDGWGDGRLDDDYGSDVPLNDFGLIEEFDGLTENKDKRLAKLHALGDQAAAHLRAVLPDARPGPKCLRGYACPTVPRVVLARGENVGRQ